MSMVLSKTLNFGDFVHFCKQFEGDLDNDFDAELIEHENGIHSYAATFRDEGNYKARVDIYFNGSVIWWKAGRTDANNAAEEVYRQLFGSLPIQLTSPSVQIEKGEIILLHHPELNSVVHAFAKKTRVTVEYLFRKRDGSGYVTVRTTSDGSFDEFSPHQVFEVDDITEPNEPTSEIASAALNSMVYFVLLYSQQDQEDMPIEIADDIQHWPTVVANQWETEPAVLKVVRKALQNELAESRHLNGTTPDVFLANLRRFVNESDETEAGDEHPFCVLVEEVLKQQQA